MISKLTTLASGFKGGPGGITFTNGLEASTEYLFNTKNIKDLKAYETNDSEFIYVFEPSDRNAGWATILVDETKSAINTKQNLDAADGSLSKVTIDLDVYEDDDLDSTAVAHSFLKDDFVFGAAYNTTKSKVWFNRGGFEVVSHIVDHTLDEIVTLAEAVS